MMMNHKSNPTTPAFVLAALPLSSASWATQLQKLTSLSQRGLSQSFFKQDKSRPSYIPKMAMDLDKLGGQQGSQGDKKNKTKIEPCQNDVLLGELMFTHPDELPALIEERLDKLDDQFYAYIQQKINNSNDLEERTNLKMLTEAITFLLQEMLKSKDIKFTAGEVGASARKEETQVVGEDDSKNVMDLPAKKQDEGFQVISEKEWANESYVKVISELSKAAGEEDDQALTTKVDQYYNQIDMNFLTKLDTLIGNGGTDKLSVGSLEKIKDFINVAMSKRIATATDTLKQVISCKSPNEMVAKMGSLNKQGLVDESFILLLEANLQQAQQANATGAVNLMKMLRDKASTMKQSTLTSEIKLIRQLLQTADKDAREQLLLEAFTPKESIYMADGSRGAATKVDGKRFVDAMRKLIVEFGHVDQEFVKKCNLIAEESEQVAMKIFGLGPKDTKTLQDEAFNKRTVSVWDLEKAEIQAEVQGIPVPWQQAGFNQDGVRKM